MSTPSKSKRGSSVLPTTLKKMGDPDHTHTPPSEAQLKEQNTKDCLAVRKKGQGTIQAKTDQQSVKPNANNDSLKRKLFAIFILILVLTTGILAFRLLTSHPISLEEKSTKVFTLPSGQQLQKSQYDLTQNGKTTHFQVTTITSEQNGTKKSSSFVQTPILLDSVTVQTTKEGEFVYYVDPKKLLAQLKKANPPTQRRRLQRQSDQTQTSNQQSETQQYTEQFWKGLIVPESQDYYVIEEQYLACEERKGQNGEYFYEPVLQENERLLAERQLLSYEFVPFLQQNGRREALQATYKLNQFAKEIEKINNNKFNLEKEIMDEKNQNNQNRNILNDDARCFDRDSKKYCPASVWQNSNLPYKVSPSFNFENQRYERFPVFTLEKTHTQAAVQGHATAGGYAQNNEYGSSSGHQISSDFGGKGTVTTGTTSERGTTLTYGTAKGQAYGSGNGEINNYGSSSQSQAVSNGGKVISGAQTQTKNTSTNTQTSTFGSGTASGGSQITANGSVSNAQSASQPGGQTNSQASTKTKNTSTKTQTATSGYGTGSSSAQITQQQQFSVSQVSSILDGFAKSASNTITKDSATATKIQAQGNANGVANSSVNSFGSSSYTSVSSTGDGSASASSSTLSEKQSSKSNIRVNSSGNTGTSSGNVASTTTISNNQGSATRRP